MSREPDAGRRRAILDAALACFLQFGYDKTSLDDIARQAGLSRALIYRKFPNKETIFGSLLGQIFKGRSEAALSVLEEGGETRKTLFRIYEIMLLEPWEVIGNSPMVGDFYATCVRLQPEEDSKRKRQLLKYTQALIPDRETSEVFKHAVAGLSLDMPKPRVFRRRLEVLVEKFVPKALSV